MRQQKVNATTKETCRLTEAQRELIEKWRFLVGWSLQRWAYLADRIGNDLADGVALDGLIAAVQCFDPDRGVQFNTYAIRAIWSYLWREAERSGVVRRKSGNRHGPPVAVCVPLDDCRPIPARAPGPDALDFLAVEAALDAMRFLPARERLVIRRVVMDGATLAAVAAELGICQESVRVVKEKALARLRRRLAKLEREMVG